MRDQRAPVTGTRAARASLRRWSRRARELVKPPQGNAVVLAVLRSRAHRLLSGSAIELRYAGRRSGRQYELPEQYAGAGDHLVVRPQHWQNATWWRNFRTPQPVTVRVAGRLRHGTARVLDPGDPDWRSARQTYATRWPRSARHGRGPLVVISLRP